MSDISHQWGADLSIGPTGDIAVVTGSALGHQRVLRRLLTNLLDYIWQPNYGAGLAGFVGQPANGAQIRAVIRSQIFKEAVVATSPEPTIGVTVNPGGAAGDIYVYITYADATTGTTQTLSFSVSA